MKIFRLEIFRMDLLAEKNLQLKKNFSLRGVLQTALGKIASTIILSLTKIAYTIF